MLQLAGLVLFMRPGDGPRTLAAAILFGFGMGAAVPLQSTTTAASFGPKAFARASGLLRPFMLPLHAGGAPFAGYLYDRTGSYALAFTVFAVCYFFAALAIALLPPRAADR